MWLVTRWRSLNPGVSRGSWSQACNASRTYASRPRWTKQEDSDLALRAKEGKSTRKIASELNRTYSSVDQHLKRIGLHKRRTAKRIHWSDSELQKVQAAHDSGKTWPEIASEFPECTLRQIQAACTRCVIEKASGVSRGPQKSWSEDEVEQLVALHSERVPIAEICQRMHRTAYSVRYKLSTMKQNEKRELSRWSAAEDQILLRAREEGTHGCVVRAAMLLPNRSRGAVRQRWYMQFSHRSIRIQSSDAGAEVTKPEDGQFEARNDRSNPSPRPEATAAKRGK